MNWLIFLLFILFSLSVCCQVAVAWWRDRLSVPFALCAPPWVNNTVVNVRTVIHGSLVSTASGLCEFLIGIHQAALLSLEAEVRVIYV